MGVIAREGIKGTAVTYIGTAIGAATTFCVVTRFLSAEEYGLVQLLIDTATLFGSLAQLGTSTSLIRFHPHFKGQHPQTQEETMHGFFFWAVVVPLLGFAAVGGLYMGLRGTITAHFSARSPLYGEYYSYALPIALFMLYQTVWETCSNVRLHIVFPRAVREIFVRIGMLAVYLLHGFGALTRTGFVEGVCIVYALAMVMNMVYFLWTEIQTGGSAGLRGLFVPDTDFLRRHGSIVRQYMFYTGFLILSAVATAFAPYLSSFVLSAQEGLGSNGIFKIAFYISVMVSIPYRSLGAIASPLLSASLQRGDTQEAGRLMQRAAGSLLLAGTLILCGIWINIDLIFYLLPNGEVYAEGRWCVLLLGLGQLLLSTFSIATAALNYSRHYYLSLLLSAILTGLSLLLNSVLIPHYGVNGAAAANLLAYIVYLALTVCAVGFSTGTTPFSSGMLKTAIVGTAVLLLNALWQRTLPSTGPVSDPIIRSIVLVGLACITAKVWQISPDLIHVTEEMKGKVQRRRKRR